MYILALKLRGQPKEVRAGQFHGVQRDAFARRDRIAVEGPDFCVLAAAGDILERDRLELDRGVACCQTEPQNSSVAVFPYNMATYTALTYGILYQIYSAMAAEARCLDSHE